MEKLALAIAALNLLDKLMPIIDADVKAGTVSVEDQKKVRTEYENLVGRLDELFDGPQWKDE